MHKVLAKELGIDNIRLLIRLWGILTTNKFDKRNVGLNYMLNETGFSIRETVLFFNSPAERLGMAGLTFFLPFKAWRLMGILLCRLLGRESYMAVMDVRRD